MTIQYTNRYADLVRNEMKEHDLPFEEHAMENGNIFLMEIPGKNIPSPMTVSCTVRENAVATIMSVVTEDIPADKLEGMKDLINELNKKARFVKFYIHNNDLVCEEEFIILEQAPDQVLAEHLVSSTISFAFNVDRYMPQIMGYLWKK